MEFPGLSEYKNKKNFFSREKETESILELLQNNKLVTITSKSGTGKSSLVNSGIIPRLENGFPGVAGRKWEICKFRPGISPIVNFCNKLSNSGHLYIDKKAKSSDFINYLKQIQKDSSALINIYNNSEISAKKNLLVYIDQIEDLFIYKKFFDSENTQDDDLLIDLIYKSVKSEDSAIYFIINVQANYLSDLNIYGKFSELLSSSQYVLPNIDFKKLIKNINTYNQDFNINFSPNGFNYIKNLITEDATLLPNLQVFLNKICLSNSKENILIDIEKIEDLGGVKNIISKDLDAFYNNLSSGEKKTCELFFRALVHSDEFKLNNYYQSFGYLCEYTQLSPKELYRFIKKINENIGEIVDVFSKNITSITSLEKKDYQKDDIVTLKYYDSYNWPQLRKWIKHEDENYELYLEFKNKEKLYPDKETLLKKPILDIARNWINQDFVNKKWANKYSFNFQNIKNFIQESINQNKIEEEKIDVENKRKEKWKKRAQIAPPIIAIILFFFVVFTIRECNEQKTIVNEFQKKKDLYTNLSQKKDSLKREIDNFQESKILFTDTINNYRERHISDSIRIRKKDELINYEEKIISEKTKLLNSKFQKIDSLQKQNELSEDLIKISTDEILFNINIEKLNTEIKLTIPSESNFEQKVNNFAVESINLYDSYLEILSLKNKISQKSNKNHEKFYLKSDENDRNHLRELALNIISKINKVQNYSEINKFNLLKKLNSKSLLSLAVSKNGKIATGGTGEKLYFSNNNINIDNDIIFDVFNFESTLTDVIFINEKIICVRLLSNQIWYCDLESKNKVLLYSKKLKRKERLEVADQAKKHHEKLTFVDNKKSIFFVSKDNLVEYNLLKKKTTEINFGDLENNEAIEDIEYNSKKHIIITTSLGNIIYYNIESKIHKKILGNEFNLTNDDKIVHIEIFEDNLFVGSKNGWIYIFKLRNNKLSYINRIIAHKYDITEMYFNNYTIYSSGSDGTFTINPINIGNKKNKEQNKILIQLASNNYINSIKTIDIENEKYVLTVDKKGRLIYWNFDIEYLFEYIKNSIKK